MNTSRKICSIALALIMIITLFITIIPVYATEDSDTIKVGYYIQDRFQMMDEKTGKKSGLGYEYLQKVAQYGGFKYEYVYDTYDNLYDKLINGDIDIMIRYSMDDDEEGVCGVGERVMLEAYYIYKRFSDTSMTYNDPTLYYGKTFGVLENSSASQILLSYLDSLSWFYDDLADNINIVFYQNEQKIEEDFLNEKIDAVIGKLDYSEGKHNITRIDCIGYYQYYINMVGTVEWIEDEYYSYPVYTPSNTELAEKISSACERFLKDEPGYPDALIMKYYGDETDRLELSIEEREYLAKNKVLTVGYLDNYLPFSSTDKDGNVTGMIKDILPEMFEEIAIDDSVSIKYQAFPSWDKMLEALNDGTIDCAYPFIGNVWEAEELGFSCTNGLFNCDTSIIVNGTYSKSKIKTIAVNGTIPTSKSTANEYFPDAKILMFDTTEECLEAVKSGKADGTMMGTLRAGEILKNRKYKTLSSISLQQTLETRFGVKLGNIEVLEILNRGIYGLDNDFASSTSYDYLDGLYNYSTLDYLVDNASLILFILAIVLAIIIIVIVTETRKRAKINKKHQEELETARNLADEANNAKTAFLFNMSHDIRTPMNAMTGFTNMAKKHIDDKEKALDCLDKAQQAGNMLLSLINSVLEVSRIESGNAVLEEQHGDVNYSFTNIETAMYELANAKNINLTFEIGEVQNRYVLCDFSRCMRVFVNVISNAIKYTPEGGYVKVKGEQLSKAENGYAVYKYTIEDNGIGMSEEFQKHVFDQFARENNSTVSGIQGTGLGMSVVKSFVDLMGGTIECKSKQGEGTTFTILLPLKVQDGDKYTDPRTGAVISSSDPTELPEDIDLTGKVTLLVEDNELNREITVEILEEHGILVEEAFDGSEAVNILKEKGPNYYDFILMDIQMPIMGGYEATKLIREMYPNERIPIIALSANAFSEDKTASIEAGMDAHIAKPIDIKTLLLTVRDLIK